MLCGIANEGLNIFLIGRSYRPQGLHLENTGVGTIERPRKLIKEKVALDEPLQIIPDALALRFIHGYHSPPSWPPAADVAAAVLDGGVLRFPARMACGPHRRAGPGTALRSGNRQRRRRPKDRAHHRALRT